MKLLVDIKSLEKSYIPKLFLVFILYFFTGKLGLTFHAVHDFATLIWFPTGLSLAALLLFGYSVWPAIATAAFALNFTTGAPPLVAMGMAFGNTLEALIGAYLFKLFIGQDNSLNQLKKMIIFITVVAALSTIISATIGTTSLFIGKVISRHDYFETWQTWWIGDLISDLILAPMLLFFSLPILIKFTFRTVLEIILTAGLLIFTYAIVFFGIFGVDARIVPLTYIIFIPLILISIRFGQKSAISALFFLWILAVYATARGVGPFAHQGSDVNLLPLHGFMIVTTVTTMIHSTAILERELAEKRKNEFISLASHELKTPTTTIKAYTQILRRYPTIKKNQKTKIYLARMETQVDKLTRLVVDLLDVSRLLADKLDLRKEKFPIQKLVKESVDNINLIHNHHKIILESQGKMQVYADRERIGQVIDNILTNAIKYSPKSKKVYVKIMPKNDQVIISIKDRGIGIDEQYHKQLFQRFFRVDEKQAGKYPGLGLGLYLSSEIIKRHDGKLWFKSKLSRGSTFYVSLQIIS